jgi:hypothetical protein
VTITLTFLPLAGSDARLAIFVLYFLGVLQSLFVFKHAGNFSFLNAIFFRALRRRKRGGQIQWKGRNVG